MRMLMTHIILQIEVFPRLVSLVLVLGVVVLTILHTLLELVIGLGRFFGLVDEVGAFVGLLILHAEHSFGLFLKLPKLLDFLLLLLEVSLPGHFLILSEFHLFHFFSLV